MYKKLFGIFYLCCTLGACSTTRYSVVCKDAPITYDVLGSDIRHCDFVPAGSVLEKRTVWGRRTYYIDRCDNFRVVRFKRIKAVK